MAAGRLAGYPVVDVKVTLVDGKYLPVDSGGRSFEMVGRRGIKQGLLECRPTLLEPCMDVEITVPDESMGDVNARHGRIQGRDAAPGNQPYYGAGSYG